MGRAPSERLTLVFWTFRPMSFKFNTITSLSFTTAKACCCWIAATPQPSSPYACLSQVGWKGEVLKNTAVLQKSSTYSISESAWGNCDRETTRDHIRAPQTRSRTLMLMAFNCHPRSNQEKLLSLLVCTGCGAFGTSCFCSSRVTVATVTFPAQDCSAKGLISCY